MTLVRMGIGTVVATTGKLDMEPSREDGADKTCLGRQRRHTSDHDGGGVGFAKQAGVRCVNVDSTVAIKNRQHYSI